jgi:hypothetical protein
MSDLDKALRVHTALVKAGVDPEYARVQLKHQADQLGSLSPEDLTAQILGGTPQSHMARKAEEPGATSTAPAGNTVDEMIRRNHERAKGPNPLLPNRSAIR